MSAINKWQEVERNQRAKAHKSEIDGYKKQIELYQQAVEELEEQLGVALTLGKEIPPAKPLEVKATNKATAVAVALASDWHVEEEVEAKSVNDLNEFTLGIAEKRIHKFFKTVARLTEIERAGADIDTLVLWCGGDLFSGYIHEELRETNSMSPTETILWLQDLVIGGIETLKPHFKEILIPTSFGNHGRTTIKPRHATAYKNSYEWLLYKVLEARTTDEKVKWQISDSYHNLMTVFDKRIRFHHGDGLKYQGGIGGLTIPVEKAISSWNKSPARADLDVFGHWHTFQQNRNWVSNGSLIGYNAYAVSIKASYEPPAQTYFLFDKKRGRTMTTPILFDI
jgi:hypothetical protein